MRTSPEVSTRSASSLSSMVTPSVNRVVSQASCSESSGSHAIKVAAGSFSQRTTPSSSTYGPNRVSQPAETDNPLSSNPTLRLVPSTSPWPVTSSATKVCPFQLDLRRTVGRTEASLAAVAVSVVPAGSE